MMHAVVVAMSAVLGQAEAASPVRLFNGKDLTGWTAVHDGKYEVHGDILVIAGGNGWLRGNREYDDFDLSFDWRVDAKYASGPTKYDSGLFFRSTAEGKPWPKEKLQINLKQGEEGNLPGIHKQGYPNLVRPPGEWNTFRLVALGPKLEVFINHKPAWSTDKLPVRRGYLGFQAEGHRFEFRNIVLSELGFKPAFNGKDLTGWIARGKKDRWQVDGNRLINLGGGGWLHTDKEYRDAIVNLEFRLPKNGNSGLFLRSAPTGNPAFSGMEIQLLDDRGDHGGKLQPWQHTGSLYGAYAPAQDMFAGIDVWQHLLVYCVGNQVQVWYNGTQIVDADLLAKPPFHHDPPLTNRAQRGSFGLQDHSSTMEFRNVLMKVLD